jgi:preprotein translocase subunit YajC
VPLVADSSSSGSGILTFLPIILIFVLMYFLMIRPQSKRRREAQEMQSQLGPGDEVQTVGGLFATVVAVDGEVVTLEAAPGVSLRYTRGAIARVITRVAGEADETDEDSDSDDLADDPNADASRTVEHA